MHTALPVYAHSKMRTQLGPQCSSVQNGLKKKKKFVRVPLQCGRALEFRVSKMFICNTRIRASCYAVQYARVLISVITRVPTAL